MGGKLVFVPAVSIKQKNLKNLRKQKGKEYALILEIVCGRVLWGN